MSVKVTGVVAVPLLHILREFAATADLPGRRCTVCGAEGTESQ